MVLLSSRTTFARSAAVALALLLPLTAAAQQDSDDDAPISSQSLPNTGQTLTPLAPHNSRFEPLNPNLTDNPTYTAGQAVTTATSPDGKTLLILTSGYNLVNYSSGPKAGQLNSADSNEYVFIYDIARPLPRKSQVIQVPNTYAGITFDPNGTSFYVSGGDNDNVHIYTRGTSGLYAEAAHSPVSLGHTAGNGLGVPPEAAGLAITADGTRLVWPTTTTIRSAF